MITKISIIVKILLSLTLCLSVAITAILTTQPTPKSHAQSKIEFRKSNETDSLEKVFEKEKNEVLKKDTEFVRISKEVNLQNEEIARHARKTKHDTVYAYTQIIDTCLPSVVRHGLLYDIKHFFKRKSK